MNLKPTRVPASRLATQAAALVRSARVRLSMTTVELGHRSDVSRQMIGDIERGKANPTASTLQRIFEALELDVDLVAMYRTVMLGNDPRQRDAAHAVLSGYIQRRLEAAGWAVRREVRIEVGRYHGWVDLLAFDQATGTLLVIEIKTVLDDVGAIERTLDWYGREASAAVARFGWQPQRMVPWLLLLATDDVDTALRSNRAAIDRAFPVRAGAMSQLVANPGIDVGSPNDHRPGLALVDPRSRRRDWLIRSTLDGRRSPARYRGYGDFIQRWRGGRQGRARSPLPPARSERTPRGPAPG